MEDKLKARLTMLMPQAKPDLYVYFVEKLEVTDDWHK
jgi:hypothetical protein